MCGDPDTVISPFIALLISSQDATINIELPSKLPLFSAPQVRPLAHTPSLENCIWGGENRRSTGEAHAFIIKVSWDALQHLEVLKRVLL